MQKIKTVLILALLLCLKLDLYTNCIHYRPSLNSEKYFIAIFVIYQPTFLTKEQRAAEALKRRQEQVDEQRKKLEVLCNHLFHLGIHVWYNVWYGMHPDADSSLTKMQLLQLWKCTSISLTNSLHAMYFSANIFSVTAAVFGKYICDYKWNFYVALWKMAIDSFYLINKQFSQYKHLTIWFAQQQKVNVNMIISDPLFKF